MIINCHRNDKLAGYHVLYMEIAGQFYSKSVDEWIALEPVLLYQAVMGMNKCCVTTPQHIHYSPSLQYTVLKKLEKAVSRIKPQLIGEKETRKLKRVASSHFKKRKWRSKNN